MDSSIGVLVTSFKRPHTLAPQLSALDAQTVKPADVIIWHNHGGIQPHVEAMRGRKVVAANFNSGVWARFSAALWLLKTEFIVVLDDDTIPGQKWLERCLNQYCLKPALLGVNGVAFVDGTRNNRSYTGRLGHRTRVDIVGHGWFIHRSLIREACATPSYWTIPTAGEDYHLAFAAQRLRLPTEIPGYKMSIECGSMNPNLGTDEVALYRQPQEEENKRKAHDYYRAMGWKTLYDLDQECNSRMTSAKT